MIIKIKDPLGVNGFGGTYRKRTKSELSGYFIANVASEYKKISEDDIRYKNDSLRSKKYFSRQEVVERKVEKLFKACKEDVKRGNLRLVNFSCSNDDLTIEFCHTRKVNIKTVYLKEL